MAACVSVDVFLIVALGLDIIRFHPDTQGGYAYNVGITSFHWSPVCVFAGIWAAFMYGSMASVPSGFLVWIYSPFINMSGVEVFYGIGGSIFVGLGAAVMGRSPLIELIAIVNLHVDFWIMVRTGMNEGKQPAKVIIPKHTLPFARP